MYTKYANAEEIEKIQLEVSKICPDLKLNRFTSRNNIVYEVGLEIVEKGNKHIIEKLQSIGFRKFLRIKKELYSMYDGYSFLILMEKDI